MTLSMVSLSICAADANDYRINGDNACAFNHLPDNALICIAFPNASGGYHLDGRLVALQEQALVALTAHAELHVALPQGMSAPPYFHNNSAASLEEAVDHYARLLTRKSTGVSANSRCPRQ
jgi:cytochrome c peroxidase